MQALSRNWITKIPLRYIVAAMARLPAPGPAAERQQVDVDAGPAGRFRVTFICMKSQVGRGAYWMAQHADRLGDTH